MNYSIILFLFSSVARGDPVSLCISALVKSLGTAKVLTSNIPLAYNKVYEDIVPSAMVFPSNGAEVATVLNTCHGFGVVVAVRAHSGHSYIAQSTIDRSGIVMNLSNLNKFQVVSGSRLVADVSSATSPRPAPASEHTHGGGKQRKDGHGHGDTPSKDSASTKSHTHPESKPSKIDDTHIQDIVDSHSERKPLGEASLRSQHVRGSAATMGPRTDDTPTVIVGGGLALLEVYSRLAMNNPPLGLNGGTCPSVSVGGLISGGGEGMTSTFGGITSDRVIGAKAVVFVDGKFKEVVAQDDLLFALRGGMGGNYGVVTEWTLGVFPVNKVYLYSLRSRALVPGTDDASLHTLTRTYTAWLRNPSSPAPLPAGNSVWGMIKFLGGGTLQLSGQCKCASSSCSDCSSAVAHLVVILGTKLGIRVATDIQDFGQAMWSWGGCTDWGGVSAYPSGGLTGISETKLQKAMAACYKYDYDNFRGPYKAKSLYLPDETRLGSSFESTALHFVTLPVCTNGVAKCYLQMSLVGGAMLIQHPNSAFVHRTPGFHLQMIVNWQDGTTSAPFLDWTRQARAAILPLSLNEAYQNYPDTDLDIATWSAEYFKTEEVFERLISIKAKYNPTNIFNVPQALSMLIPQSGFSSRTDVDSH